MNDSDEVTHLDSIAEQFGVSRERVYQLEASAKRKIATALTQEGYGDFARTGTGFRLPQVRARRRVGVSALPLRKDKLHPQSAAQS
jgi:hypothetical protein